MALFSRKSDPKTAAPAPAPTAPAILEAVPVGRELATFGGGCFWCLEAVFEQVKGVEKVVSGYSGGHKINPTYHEVCDETTGHAEVVQVTFDPKVVSYKQLLEVFFTIHDPTTLNRQGPDHGTSYRSAVYYRTLEQKAAIDEVLAWVQKEKLWKDPVVTEIAQFKVFYPAEEYHQGYFRNNPYQPYCQVIVAPKVAKFRSKFMGTLLRA